MLLVTGCGQTVPGEQIKEIVKETVDEESSEEPMEEIEEPPKKETIEEVDLTEEDLAVLEEKLQELNSEDVAGLS